MREQGMMLRRAGLGLLVGAVLMAPAGASAAPALVFEPYNGTVFYAEDPDASWFPASLTKLMTAYVTFQALKEGTVTPATRPSSRAPSLSNSLSTPTFSRQSRFRSASGSCGPITACS